MKYYDAELSSTAVSTVTTTWVAGTMKDPSTSINIGDAAVANPLALVVPKVSAALNGRIGRSIYVNKIKVRGRINVPIQAAQAAADSATTVRVLLVQDMQTNAGQMTGAQLLNDGGAADTTLRAYQNPNSFGRFRVLKDKLIVMQNPQMANDTGATGGIVQAGLTRNFKLTANFRVPVKVQFNATNGGTVADIVDNSFHVLAGQDFGSLAATIAYYSRVAYKE